MIVYRDKQSSNYNTNAIKFLERARELSFNKILIHGNVALAFELKADGVHLTSTQFGEIINAKSRGLFVVISTHTLDEAIKAESMGADMVTISPIFHSPNKGEPLGLLKLQDVCNLVKIPVIALGGIISQEQIDKCKKVGASGFASIRYFAN
jgi:thiamine-phosphate pyrophosphorylase